MPQYANENGSAATKRSRSWNGENSADKKRHPQAREKTALKTSIPIWLASSPGHSPWQANRPLNSGRGLTEAGSRYCVCRPVEVSPAIAAGTGETRG